MSPSPSLPASMLSATVHPTNPITTTVSTIALPASLDAHQVLVQVQAAASNPKDWLHLVARNVSLNSGDDLAGTVVAVGAAVSTVQVGDRVAAFHPMGEPWGAYAEYAVAPDHTVLRLPDAMTAEEGSTIPLVSLTAALTLFRRQHFAPPWAPTRPPHLASAPLLVYAATSALGTYAIKLAKMAGIGPIIAVGGGSSAHLRTVLDEHDVFVDYRPGWDHVKAAVQAAVAHRHLLLAHAIDAYSEDGSWVRLADILGSGVVSVFSGARAYDEPAIPAAVQIRYTFVGTGHTGAYRAGMPKQPPAEEARGDVAFAAAFYAWLEGVLARGGSPFTGHPYEVVPGGLHGVADGLNRLRRGQAGGKKLVYQIGQEGKGGQEA